MSHLYGRPQTPRWIPDSEANNCMSCDGQFTFNRRKHHCRLCGRVICGSCSRNKVRLGSRGGSSSIRVCDDCFLSFSGGQTVTTAALARPNGAGMSGSNGNGNGKPSPAQALLGAPPSSPPNTHSSASQHNGYEYGGYQQDSQAVNGSNGVSTPQDNSKRMLYESPLLAKRPFCDRCGCTVQ